MKRMSAVHLIALFAVLAIPLGVQAQQAAKPKMYKVIDVGTFGGPNTGSFAIMNNRGMAVGQADTNLPDPFSPNCMSDCYLALAFEWQNGTLTNLGALAPGVDSFAFSINLAGQIVGVSEDGAVDPLTGFPETRGALWENGKIIGLGTLGGYDSIASAINDRGEIVGGALNTTPDAFSNCAQPFPYATQVHAVLWQADVMHDLGTLGGNDSCALFVNDQGQVAGGSYTNITPNSVTGYPTLAPFLWEDGRMLDLGTLGGTSGLPNGLNNRGQVVGQSNLLGDLTFHPFLWDRGVLHDLGTFGGPSGSANGINDDGQVVGYGDLPGGPCQGFSCMHHAFLWEHGVKTDLGTLPTEICSNAVSINQSGQIVGYSTPFCNSETYHPFIWENGAMYDVRALIVPGSDITLEELFEINDRGEMVGFGLTPNGDLHTVVLVPQGDCDDACESRIAAGPIHPAAPSNRISAMHGRLARKFHLPSPGPSN